MNYPKLIVKKIFFLSAKLFANKKLQNINFSTNKKLIKSYNTLLS